MCKGDFAESEKGIMPGNRGVVIPRSVHSSLIIRHKSIACQKKPLDTGGVYDIIMFTHLEHAWQERQLG